ncbi:MAG: hypothetical protein WA130_07035 [Candidatus Methanoperedens sp.]
MTPKEPIETLIRELEKLYDAPADQKHKDFYSKLALIELCGWLEISMDEIVKGYSTTKLVETKNQENFKKEIIDKTYGCDYKDHLRPMLINLIGLKGIETLEATLKEDGVFQILVAQLGSLWSLRGTAAHTTIVGVTITYQSPSAMKKYLDSLHPILTTLEVELTKL